ncbi:MAG: hypothetical protein NTZ74_10820 [Chloroflexi bacterium]|nr:hypothetical protein [Chloroflexota bacterium]
MDLRNIENFENGAIDLVAKVAPWCAPFPTAYLVGRATVTHLEWPVIIGILAAAVIESLGLVTCATALDLYQFNQNRRKNDPPAPFWLAVFLILLYFLVAVLLTVVLDTQPAWSVIAPVIFPFLSLAGVTVIALRKDYQKRLQQIVNEKAERKAERQTNHGFQRQDLSSFFEPAVSNEMSNNRHHDINLNRLQAGRKAKLDDRLDRLLDTYRVNPTLGISDAARILDVSRQTIYSYNDQLLNSGKIRRNGHRIEVLE